MTVQALMEALNLQCQAGEKGLLREVKGVYMGDVLSLAMAHAKEGEIWLTTQGHVNTIAVATLIQLPAILLVQDAKGQEEMKEAADREGIAVLVTQKRSYEMAKLLMAYF